MSSATREASSRIQHGNRRVFFASHAPRLGTVLARFATTEAFDRTRRIFHEGKRERGWTPTASGAILNLEKLPVPADALLRDAGVQLTPTPLGS